MADESGAPPSDAVEHRLELRKEALTMALYVSICLMASLIAIPKSAETSTNVLALMWGVTVGLALAHWFAFRVSARMVGAGKIQLADIQLAAAQLLAAAGVALLGTLAVLLLPDTADVAGAELLLAVLIALIGFGVALGAGATRLRAVAYSLVVLAGAVIIAVVKNVLAGH